jgi:hypothetical protein
VKLGFGCRWFLVASLYSSTIVPGSLQVKVDCVLELPDQKARVVLVLITLTQWFVEYTRKVFGEMPMRT